MAWSVVICVCRKFLFPSCLCVSWHSDGAEVANIIPDAWVHLFADIFWELLCASANIYFYQFLWEFPCKIRCLIYRIFSLLGWFDECFNHTMQQVGVTKEIFRHYACAVQQVAIIHKRTYSTDLEHFHYLSSFYWMVLHWMLQVIRVRKGYRVWSCLGSFLAKREIWTGSQIMGIKGKGVRSCRDITQNPGNLGR